MGKSKHIVFTKKNTAELIETDVPQLGNNDVKVKTVISTISCGTEKANISGNLNVSIYEEAAKEAPADEKKDEAAEKASDSEEKEESEKKEQEENHGSEN